MGDKVEKKERKLWRIYKNDGFPPVVQKDCEYRERVCVSTLNVDWKYIIPYTLLYYKRIKRL